MLTMSIAGYVYICLSLLVYFSRDISAKQIRLMDGPNLANEGRVEVYDNDQWYGLCAYNWDTHGADVVCRQLGYSYAIIANRNHYGSSGRTSNFSFNCTGQERNTADCSTTVGTSDSCLSGTAGVVCSSSPLENGALRLAFYVLRYGGRLEYYFNGQWGTVCDSNWDYVDAKVACKKMGFLNAEYYKLYSPSGSSSQPIWVNNVECTGNEMHLTDCSGTFGGTSSCTHTEDIGISCSRNAHIFFKLVNGPNGVSLNEGRVQIYAYANTINRWNWHDVCADEWDLSDADAVCLRLGYPYALVASKGSQYGTHIFRIFTWEFDLHCGVTDVIPSECSFSNSTTCSQGTAGILCSTERRSDGSLRLADGGSKRYGGRLEYSIGSHWVTLCYNGWNITDAQVACRQMGFDSVISLYKTARTLAYSVSLGELSCNGSEQSLQYCPGTNISLCSDSEHVGIICSTKQIRLMDGPNLVNEGRVEVYDDDQWYGLCAYNWDTNGADVVCRHLGYHYAIIANRNHYGSSGRTSNFSFSCTGNENSIDECSTISLNLCQSTAGVVCSSSPLENGAMRLAFYVLRYGGRLEYYFNGQWGTVCGTNWNYVDANVACKKMGFLTEEYYRLNSPSGSSSQPIWVNNVECAGNETNLIDCSGTFNGTNSCTHTEDIGISCSRNAHIFFKLVNGPNGDSLNEGRVQIYAYANIITRWTWHDVCADEWDLSDADAVCLNLGYPYAIVASKGSQYGTHINGTTWEFDLHCGATDVIPSECSFSNSTTCSQGTAGILCSTERRIDGSLRLADGGSKRYGGRLEYSIFSQWVTLCYNGWNITDAQVACRQMGFDSVISLYKTARTLAYSISLGELSCNGSEQSLQYCPGTNISLCSDSEHVGIICSTKPIAIRLMDGPNLANEGRVEVYDNDQWYGLCAYNWDTNGADVICRQLGYHYAIIANRYHYGSSERTSNFSFSCTGQERSTADCSTTVGTSDSCQSGTAGVVCSSSPLENGAMRLAFYVLRYGGRLEYYFNGQWGTVCGSIWDFADANVACKKMGFLTEEYYRINIPSGSSSQPIWVNNVECAGNETNLIDCSGTFNGTNNCTHTEDIGISCSRNAHIFFKLVNGPNGDSLNEGRVQIYAYANIINRWDWHDVCADEWDLSDADAVCLNLGYPYAVVASKGSQYGTHINGTTWEFDLHCGATDIIPSECSFSNSTTCSQGTAGILCSTERRIDGSLRLADGGSKRYGGRLEYSIGSHWVTLCYNGWNITDAQVACRQMGFDSVISLYKTARTLAYSVSLGELSCNGSEQSLQYCPGTNISLCSDSEHVGIICSIIDTQISPFENSALGTPAIIGISVGSVLGLLICVVIVCVFYTKRSKKRSRRNRALSKTAVTFTRNTLLVSPNQQASSKEYSLENAAIETTEPPPQLSGLASTTEPPPQLSGPAESRYDPPPPYDV